MTKRNHIDLSISLVSHNSCELLKNCLNSIIQNVKSLTFEILLVDNASSDGTPSIIRKKFPQIKLTVNSKNLLFTKAHNQNLKKVAGRYFLILNADTVIHPKTVERIIVFIDAHPYVGLASCRQIDEHGKTDMTCSKLPHPLIEIFESSFIGKLFRRVFRIARLERAIGSYRYSSWKRDTVREVDVLPGSFFLGRSELLTKVGFFDENLLLFYEEPDYCKRAKVAGFLSYHFGDVTITHLRAKTIAKLPLLRRHQIAEHDMLYYYKKYFGVFWFLILWFLSRPNWIYWRIISLIRS